MKKIISLFLLFAATAHSQSFLELSDLNPNTQYDHFETDHFEFTYQQGYLPFTKEAAKHLEHAHTIISPILQWQPRSKIHVLVADNADSANGFALPSLRVGMVLIATPPDQWFSTAYSENWIKLLVFHEYTHILNIDPTTAWMEWIRIVFGDVIRPNGLWPTWMLEGLAVYFETKTSILGRGRSPYFDAVIRSYYHEGKLGVEKNNGLSYDRVNSGWPYFPGGETAYIFGYQFWNQFSKVAKNDSKMGEYSINSSHRVPFFIDGNLDNVLHKSWRNLWNSFVTENGTRYENEIQKVKSLGETPTELITHSQYSAVGGTMSHNGEWIAFTETRLDERQGLSLINLKTKKVKKIKDKILGASMAFSPDDQYLIFSSLGRDTTFTLFSDLWVYDIKNDQFTQLTNGLRAKDPDLSTDGKSVTFIQTDHATHLLKTASLVLDEKNSRIENIKTLYTPSEFSILGTPRWINSSEVVFSQQTLGQAEAKIYKVSNSNQTPELLVQNGKINRFPFLCKDQIYYVSDSNGIDNIYALNGTQLTNVVTAVQFPFCSKEGQLYGSLLTSNGFEIAKISATPFSKIKESISTPSAPESITEALKFPEIQMNEQSISSYTPWRTLAPRQWTPFGYYDYDGISGSSIGGAILGFDSVGKHQYFSTFSYNFKSETFDGIFQYTYYGFRPAISLSAQSNTSDIGGDSTRTLFKRSHETKLTFDHLIRWTWSSLRIKPYGFIDWNTIYTLGTHTKQGSSDPEFNHTQIPGGGLSVAYSNTKESKLGFMSEGGFKSTFATQAKVYRNDFTLWKSMIEQSNYISTGEHFVLNPKLRYLNSTHPYGWDRSYALLNGKNTSDITDRGTGFSLNALQIRGYSNVSIRTKSSFHASLDYHFPIDTIFSGSHLLYLEQFHGFVFAESTYVPSTRIKNLFLSSFGAGVNADTTMLWHIPLQFSFEYQNGLRKDFGGDSIFFFSIGSSLI